MPNGRLGKLSICSGF